MCSGDAPAPDANIGAAALAQANLSKEQLAWAKEIWADQKPGRDKSIANADAISGEQFESMAQQNALTAKYAGQQDKQFAYEDAIRAEADAYDSPERQAANAAKAGASVQASFDNTQAQSQRQLSRMGVNPSSGKALAMSHQLGIQKAAALAGAVNKSGTDGETQAYARKMDSANLGRNLASNQATSANVAISAGNSSANTGAASGAINAQGNAVMQTGFSGASSSMASAGGLYAQGAQIASQASSGNDALMGMVGSVAGKYAMSDVRLKTDIRGINPEAALKAINRTPVSSWRYKHDCAANDGGVQHIGPMAQDSRRTMGEQAAPGGTKIDLITMNGMAMAAIQALSHKIDRLAGPRGLRRAAA
jgi:hypothetical protein